MLEQEYEKLVQYLEEMTADGVQLVHDGHLMDWGDTNVLNLLHEIARKRKDAESITCEVGDLLQNRYTGQKAAIFLTDGDSVQMIPCERVIVYPKNRIGYHYRKSRPGE